MKQSIWCFCLAALALVGAAGAAQAERESSIDIRGLVVDIRPLTADIVGLDRSTVDLEDGSAGVNDDQVKLVKNVTELDRAMSDLAVKETKTEIRVDLSADVLFDFDKANIKPEAALALKQTALVIRKKAKGAVRISGHTDAKGSDQYNQRLSESRANSVKSWLVRVETLPSRIFQTKGYGERAPVAPNVKPDGSDNPDGRAKNRRVEIIIETVQR